MVLLRYLLAVVLLGVASLVLHTSLWLAQNGRRTPSPFTRPKDDHTMHEAEGILAKLREHEWKLMDEARHQSLTGASRRPPKATPVPTVVEAGGDSSSSKVEDESNESNTSEGSGDVSEEGDKGGVRSGSRGMAAVDKGEESDEGKVDWKPVKLAADGRVRTEWVAYQYLTRGVEGLSFARTSKTHTGEGASCEVPHVSSIPNKLLYNHKRKKASEYTPHEYIERMKEAASHIKGMEVVVHSATEIKETVNDIPILDTHGGQYNIFKPWGDKTLWKHLQFYHDVSKAKKLPQALPPQPPMWAASIPQAWVHQGNVYTCDWAFTTGACLWEMENIKQVKTTHDKVFAFCDKWCNGYFHFTHEHLPRIAPLYKLLKDDPDIKITIPLRNSYVVSYMTDVFGFNKSRLISTAPTFASRVYYPQPQKCGNIWTHTLFLLRHIVFENLNLHPLRPAPSHFPGKFVVVLGERGGKGGRSRMPTNYHNVTAHLNEQYRNTDVVIESSLNKGVAEQIRLFNRADIVLGPHGANLANVMWMRHGTTIVEYMSYRYGNMCYYMTAQRIGVLFRFIMQPSSKGGSHTIDADEVHRHIEDARRRKAGKTPLTFH